VLPCFSSLSFALIARELFGTLRTEVTLSLRSRLARNRLRVQRAGLPQRNGSAALLQQRRVSGDDPGRCREFPPFDEAPARFVSSSSRSPMAAFEISNAP